MRHLLAAMTVVTVLTGCHAGTRQNPADKCLTVSPRLVNAIASGARGRAVMRAPYSAAAVTYPALPDVYFVAVKFGTLLDIGPARLPEETGVWVNNSLAKSAELRAVDDWAYLATTWPRSSWMPESDPLVKSASSAAKACVSGAWRSGSPTRIPGG
jgi:hypothetical protein